MNKAYKVLWNRTRGQSVVTDERRSSRGKCKSKKVLVAAAVAGALGAGLFGDAALAGGITADWSHTSVVTNANVHEITSAKTLNGTDVNKFSKFELDANQVANFKLNSGSSNVLNLVNAQITVDGIVNSVTAAKEIGGNLYFVSPTGMTVGSTGAINAGSLTAVITTEDQFKKWNAWSGDAAPNNELYAGLSEGGKLLSNLQKGEVPINPAGVITVDGSIRTANKITLAAAKVSVGEKAVIRNTALSSEEIKKVVNVQEAGLTTSLDVSGMVAAETADGSGDILLLARSEGKEADAKVEVKGKVTSRGSVTAKALAGSGSYILEGSTATTSAYKFEPNNNLFKTDVSALVNLGANASVSALKDVTLDALAENVIDGSGIARTIVNTLTLGAIGATTPANFNAGYGNLTTKSEVTTEAGSVVIAGGDVTANAKSVTELVLGTSTALMKLTDVLSGDKADQIPALATVVALADTSSKVDIEGTLSAGGDLTVKAYDALTAEITASCETANDTQNAHNALLISILKGSSSVTVGKDAVLNLTGSGDAPASVVTISSEHTSRVITKASVTIPQSGYFGLSVNYTEHNTSATLDILNGKEGGVNGTAKSIVLNAANTTTRESVSAENSDGSGYGAKLLNTLATAATSIVAGIAGQAAKQVDFGYDAESFKAGGTVAVIKGSQSAKANIGGSYEATDGITVTASSVKEDHNYVSTSYVNASPSAQDKDSQTGEASFVGGLALLVALPGSESDSVTSELTVEDNASLLVTGGALRVTNEALIKYARVEALVQDILADVEKMRVLFGQASSSHPEYANLKKAWEDVLAARDQMTKDFSNISKSDAKMSQFATAVSSFGSMVVKFFKVAAIDGVVEGGMDAISIVKDALAFIKTSNYLNSYVASSAAGTAGSVSIAGSVGYIEQSAKASLVIGKGAQLVSSSSLAASDGVTDAGLVSVESSAQNDSAAAGGHVSAALGLVLPDISSSKIGIGASFLYLNLATDNVLRIREGALLSGINTAVAAVDRIDATTVLLNANVTAGNFGLDANVALANTYGNNTLEIDDEAHIEAAKTVLLEAVRDDSVQTVAVAADIGYGDSASAMVGAAVGVNIGSLSNTLTVKDNDVLAEGDKSVYDGSGWIGAPLTSESLLSPAETKVLIIAQSDLAQNAVAAAATISLAGTSDGEPGGLSKFIKWVGEKNIALTGKIQTLGNALSEETNFWGTGIRNTFKKASSQNTGLTNEGGTDPETVADNMPQPETDSSTGGGDGGTDGSGDSSGTSKSTVNIALSASAAWNATDVSNTVSISADDLTIAAGTIETDAKTDKWVGAWAGSVAISKLSKNNDVKTSVAAEGAVAGNSGDFTTTVTYTGTEGKPGIQIQGSATTSALSSGTVVAEGIAFGLSTTETGTTGVVADANVSASFDTNTVGVSASRVTVNGLTTAAGTAASVWNQIAWLGDTQVTGGTSLGFAIGSSDDTNVSAGLIVAVGQINNTVSSTFENGTVNDAASFRVEALESATQVTTAAGVHYAAGDKGVGVTGSVAVSTLTNDVTASAANSSVHTAGEAGVEISARLADSAEKKAYAALSGTDLARVKRSEIDSTVKQATAKETNKLSLLSDTVLSGLTVKTDNEGGTQNIYDFVQDAKMVQATIGLSVGVGGTAGVGAGIVVNQAANTFAAKTDSVTVTGGRTYNFAQAADNSITSVAVAVGVAGTTGDGDAAGSLIVASVTQKADVQASGLNLSGAANAAVGADNRATTVNVAGNFAVGTDSESNGGGAAVVVANSNNFSTVTLKKSSLGAADSLTVQATNKAASWAAAADITVQGGFSIGGSVVVSRINNSAQIAAETLTLQGFKNGAVFSAKDDSVLWTLSGDVGISTEKSGIAGAVAYTESGRGSSAGTVVSLKDVTVWNDAGDITAAAEESSNAHTLVLAAGVGVDQVGIGGAASVNEIVHKVSAGVDGLTYSGAHEQLGSLAVTAKETAKINSLTIAGAYGATLGLGIGVTVNKITNTTAAALKTVKGNADLKSVLVQAKTADTITNIAIGGGAGNTGAGSASVGVNLITDNTEALVDGASFSVSNGAVVEAVSDDTVSNYVGQAAGAGTGAGALAVAVNEKKGSTSAAVKNSSVAAEYYSGDTLTAAGGVGDSAIFDKVAQDFNIGYTLADSRTSNQVWGISVGATSTETIKNFVMNGAVAGTAGVVGTVTVNYLGGDTKTTVDNSTLNSASGVSVFSGDYANIGNLATTVAGGGEAAVNISVNVNTTEHATKTQVTKSQLSGGDVSVNAEGKEGVSSLTIAGSGAGSAAVTPLVNVNRLLSDVALSVENQSTVTAKNYTQAASYLGRISALGVAASGAAYAAVTPSVVVNYMGNSVKNAFAASKLTASEDASITADKDTDVLAIDVSVSGAIAGVGAYVDVNTVEGASQTNVEGSVLTAKNLTVTAGNTDKVRLTAVNVSGGGFGVSAAVVVNRLYSDANVNILSSTLTGTGSLTLKATQDRFISATSAGVAGGAVAVGTNVVATYIGDDGNPFDDFSESDSTTVAGYITEYGKPGLNGNLLKALNSSDGVTLTPEAYSAAEQAASADTTAYKAASGTKVTVDTSTLQSANVLVSAEEDTAEGAKVDVTVGSGDAGGMVLAASVATLRRNRNIAVDVLRSAVLDINNSGLGSATLQTVTGGTSSLLVWQATVAMASGDAGYADTVISGGSEVKLDSTTVRTGDLTLSAKDISSAETKAFGLKVGVAQGGATVAKVEDKSSQKISVQNTLAGKEEDGETYKSEISANLNAEAVRSGTRTAHSTAGIGGVLTGAGVTSTVKDSGGTAVLIESTSLKGSVLSVLANNRPTIKVTSEADGFIGVGGGVSVAKAEVSGTSSVIFRENAVAAFVTEITAASGSTGEDDTDALHMTALAESYGGTAAGFTVNTAELTNTTKTEAEASGNTFEIYSSGGDAAVSGRPNLTVTSVANAVYDANATIGTGGVLSIGSTDAEVTHSAVTSTAVSGSGTLASLTAGSVNQETATVKADSAGGGILDFGGTGGNDSEEAYASMAVHKDTSVSSVSLSGTWIIEGRTELSSASSHTLRYKSDNTRGAVAAVSGAGLKNDMSGSNTVSVAGALSSGTFAAYANTSVDQGAADGATYALDSDVYGAVGGTGIKLTNRISRTNAVNIDSGAQLVTAGDLTVSAYSKNTADLRVRARSAGIINGVEALANHTVSLANTVNVAENASLTTADSESELILSASGTDNVRYEALGDVQGGVASAAGAKTTVTQSRTNTVDVAKGAKLYGAGNVLLYAGKDASKNESDFDFTALSTAYAHSLIGGIVVDLTDSLAATDTVTVAGDVTAVRDIEAYAKAGTWSVSETTRWWNLTSDSNSGTYKVATSGTAGTAGGGDSFARTGTVDVTGSLLAGTNTHAEVTINGTVNTDSSVTVAGSSAEPSVTYGGAANESNVSYATTTVANMYYERYKTLQTLVNELSGGTSSQSEATALAAYRSEMAYLRTQMEARGLASFDSNGNITAVTQSEDVTLLEVKNLTVSGGSVALTADKVTGTGSITANAAEKIEIINNSNLDMSVTDVKILDKGGELTLNGKTAATLEDFKGSVSTAADQSNPTLTIESNWTGSLTVKDKTTDTTQTVTPTPDITLLGTVENSAGDVRVSNQKGDILIQADRFAASGDLKVSAASGNITQSYNAGITNIGGSVVDQWASVIAGWDKDTNATFTATAAAAAGGYMVAGGNIFLSGNIININGAVQSGFSEYSVALSNTADVTSQIAAITAKWQSKGSPSVIDVYSNDYQLTKSETVRNADGTFTKTIATWYDPVNKRIVVEDIDPKGGYISITGQLVSTGGGSIKAAAGAANVDINVGNYSVQLGNVSTGNIAGVIELTDFSYYGTKTNAGDVESLVTRWTNDGSGTTKTESYYTLQGSTNHAPVSASATSYTPKKGLVYVWSNGVETGTKTEYYYNQDFTCWGLFDWGAATENSTKNVTVLNREDLTQGETITTATNSVDGLYAWSATTTLTEAKSPEWHYTTHYKNWTHFSGTYYGYAVTSESTQTVYTYEVKADNKIDVGFLNSAGKTGAVQVTAGSDLVLGGTVSTNGGSVALTASKGSIFNANDSAAISGAASVTLSAANGSIGTAESAIKLTGGETDLMLNAAAKTNIYIDASNVGQNVNITGGTVAAGSLVNVAARNDLALDTLKGSTIALTSDKGSITVGELTQIAAKDGAERFDATAKNGNVTLSNVTGNLALGVIEAGENVSIKAEGNLTDAIARDDLDSRTAEEKIASWIEAGILSSDGTNNGEARWKADITKIEDGIRSNYTRYKALKDLVDAEGTGKLTEAQLSDYNTLKGVYESCDSAEAAIQAAYADPDSNLAKTYAAKDNYGWDVNQLLYAVSDAITNPKTDSYTAVDAANIKAKSVTLEMKGAVGEELDTKTYTFADLDISTASGLEMYKTLSRADVGDVVWNKDAGTFTVTLKRPISIEATGTVSVTGGSNIYLASEEAVTVGTVSSTGTDSEVRISAGKGITALAGSLVNGAHVVLHGGKGGIGSEDAYLNVTSGDLAFTSELDAYIASDGALNIVSLSVGDTAYLKAADGIASVVKAEDSAEAQGYVQAANLVLTTTGEDADIDLLIRGDSNVSVDNGGKSGALKLAASADAAGKGDLTVSLVPHESGVFKGAADLSAAGSAVIKSSLNADSVTVSAENIAANGIALAATNGIVLASADSVSAAGASFTSASLEISGEGTVALKEVKAVTAGDITVTGSEVALSDLAAAAVLTEEDGASTPTSLSAGGSVTVTATGQDLVAVGTTIAAGTGAAVLDAQKGMVYIDGAVITSDAGAVSVTAAENLSAAAATLSSAVKTVLGATASVDLTGASVKGKGEELLITASEGAVSAGGLTVTGAGSIEVIAEGKVDLSSSALETKKLTASSSKGAVNLAAASVSGITGDVIVTAVQEVILTDASVKGSIGTLTAASSAAGVDASGLTVDAASDLEVTAKGDIDLSSSILTTDALNAASSGGKVSLDSAAVSGVKGDVTVTAKDDVTLNDATVIGSVQNLTVASSEGKVTLEGASVGGETAKAGSVTAGTIAISAKEGIDTGEDVLAYSATVGSINLEAEDLTLLEGASLAAKENVTVVAGGDLTAQNGVTVSAGGSAELSSGGRMALGSGTSVTAEGGDLTVTAKDFTADSGLGLNAEGALTVEASEGSISLAESGASLTGSSVAVKAAGDLTAAGIQAAVTGEKNADITLTAGGKAELSGAALSGSVDALKLEGKEGLTASGLHTADGAAGTVTAGSITVATGGTLDVGTEKVTYTAAAGDLSVTAGSLDLAAGSSFTAEGRAEIEGTQRFTAGDNLTVKGSSVAVMGGTDKFAVGSGASFTSTDGDISVVASGDMTLGGELAFDASSKDAVASVTVGSDGVLSVTGDTATITAQNGQVTVYGGEGMSILDDLTVDSLCDATLKTGSGNLTVGNGAVVRAGTGFNSEAEEYGKITVDAGENFSIGENAYIHGDALSVTAGKDITFGETATLIGETDGVEVVSASGSITMGENLTVVSKANETLFSAAEGDIVIKRKGTLTSSGNEVVFEAGRDITFGDDFTVKATGFEVTAGNALTVGDSAWVHTELTGGSADTDFKTAITAGGDVVYGKDALFDTTELSVTSAGGSIIFGDNASVSTTVNGIVMEAGGDIVFGEDALLMTYDTNADKTISLNAGGSFVMGNDADIWGAGSINITAQGDITLGDAAAILHLSDKDGTDGISAPLVLASDNGSVSFGEAALVSGDTVLILAGGRTDDSGSVTFGANASVTSNSVVWVYANNAIEVGGALNMNVDADGNESGLLVLSTVRGDVTLKDGAALYANGEIDLDAGGSVSVGDNAAIVTSNAGDGTVGSWAIDINAEGAISFGANAHMETNATVALTAGDSVTLAENAFVASYEAKDGSESGRITVESTDGSVSLKGGAAFYAADTVSVKAAENVTMEGASWLDADREIAVEATAGDITMTDSIRLGGVYTDTSDKTDRITLTAGGSVTQSEIGDAMGVTADELVVSAGGAVKLDAVESGGNSAGNDVSILTVNAGGSVALAVDNVEGGTEVSINASKGGAVNGSLTVLGANTDLAVANDVAVSGSAEVHAASIAGKSLSAGGSLLMSTSSYDAGNTAGISFESVAGSSVGLLTSSGAIALGNVESASTLTVLRKGTDANAAVSIGAGSVAGHTTVFNARGDVNAALTAGGQIYVLLGSEGEAAKDGLVSKLNRVAVIRNAGAIARFIPDLYSAANVKTGTLPVFDFRSVVLGFDAAKKDGVTDVRSPALNDKTDEAESAADFCGVNPEECIRNHWTPQFETTLSDIRIDVSMNR